MGLAVVNCGAKSGVYNSMYYLSGEKNTYNWVHDETTSTVYSSTTFTNQSTKPYVSSHVCYYIVDGSVSLGGDDEFPTDNNGNAWSTSTGTIGTGCYSETTLANPTLTAKVWTAYTLAIGDVYYSDGALSRNTNSSIYEITSTRKPVAIVFTLSTSTTDRTKWSHGYAMALSDAGTASSTGVKWANDGVTPPAGTYYSGHLNIIDDMDGYTETQNIKTSNYPAAYNAIRYMNGNQYNPSVGTGTKQTSGWFLPSAGQWGKIIENLGGVTYDRDQSIQYPYWLNVKTVESINTVVNGINTRLNILNNKGCSTTSIYCHTNTFKHSGQYGYWCSTRAKNSQAFRAVFGIRPNNDEVVPSYGRAFLAITYNDNLSGNFDNVNASYTYVRSVLAF